MNISWLFDIDGALYSTKAVTYDGDDYGAKIYPDSFGGISMGLDISGNGLIYPSDINFEIDNADGAITASSLIGEICKITLITDSSICRAWKFEIQTAAEAYGAISVGCVGLLQKYLVGDYPNTPHPREVWVSANHEPESGTYSDYRIPVVFGKAYIPLMYAYDATDGTGYYPLGKDALYTITKVKAPPEDSNVVWSSGDYSFSQTSDQGYHRAEFVIAPTDTAGVYTEGVWDSSHKPLVEYSRQFADSEEPAVVIETILEDFGVPSADLDTTGTWVTAATTYATQGITFNGAYYQVEDRESVLSSLLAQCDSTIYVSDTIELIPFDNASIETFTTSKVKKFSYQPAGIIKSTSDSGHVEWAPEGIPQDTLTGKAIVSIGTTTENPDGTTFECPFINDSQVAQTLGTLHFQRQLTQENTVSFSTAGPVMTTLDTIKPGCVVTVNDYMFGGSKDIIVTGVDIEPDLTVNITGYSYPVINDFDDISPAAITVTEDETQSNLSEKNDITISCETAFKYLSGQTVPENSPILLTATLYGSLTIYAWEYWTGTGWQALSGTSDEKTYSLAYDNAAWGSATTLQIRGRSIVKTAVKTITKIYDGATGDQGEQGLEGPAGDQGLPGDDGVDAGNWSSDIVFTATDYNTVSWSSGHIYSGETTFNISAGNTGDMAAATAYYLYLNPTTSTTVLQSTTTASAAVGIGQVLVAVAYPNATTTIKAQFQSFGGRGGVFINADNVAARSFTGDKMALNSLTSAEIQTDTLVIGNLSGAGDLATQDRSDLSYTDGADQTSLNVSADTHRVDGKLASVVKDYATTGKLHSMEIHAPTDADKTTATTIGTAMDGTAVVTTGIVRDSGSNMIVNFDEATITVDNEDGLVIDGDGSIKLQDSNGTSSQISGDWLYKDYVGGNLHQTQILSTATTSQFNVTAYEYVGILGGIFSVGGTVNSAYRMIVSKASAYETTTNAALFSGNVRLEDNLYVEGDASVYGSVGVSGVMTAVDGIKPNISADIIEDYEEGTYTATLSTTGGSITLNSSYNALAYTIIGTAVHVSGRINVSAISSPTGSITLNLPVARKSGTEYSEYFTGSLIVANIDSIADAPSWLIYGGASSSSVNFIRRTTTGFTLNPLAEYVNSNSVFTVSFTYFT